MKIIILLVFLLINTKCISQVYFSPNTNMYVKNEVLYVQQGINLTLNSNLYLRNNSQLLQGTTGNSANTGLGTLSLYQKGTSDNFDYNYWCSPVGNASNSSGNENFGIAMLSRPTTATASVTSTILPVSSSDGTSNPLAIAPKWVYKLINANNYSQWVFVGGSTILAPGEGFSMKGTSGTDSTDPEGTGVTNNPGGVQRYDFRGKPNDGNITIYLGANNATLTGNPYPSALHLNAFLLDPSNVNTGGIAYFWEQDKTVNSHTLINYRGGYGAYSPISLVSNGVYVPATFNSFNPDGSINNTGLSSGLIIQRKYSPIGQGFVISANASGTATFKNAHRAFYKQGSGLSQFEKQTPKEKSAKEMEVTEEISYLKLNVIIDNEFTRQLALVFVSRATDGIDIGIDAQGMDILPNDVSFLIENNNYIIQGINFDPEKKIPIIVKATTNTTFKFKVSEVINWDASQMIYLYDALDDSFHDIKNGMYEVNLVNGIYTDRFKITFKNDKILNTINKNYNPFFINQDNINNSLKVSNPGNLSLKTFKLYEITGKIILHKENLGIEQNYTFSTNGLSSGIYIAEFLTLNNERFTEKIIISNSKN
ncbi:T9SS type A sorting domain-containing protein [Flavobacterium collinsii]|uniref:Secretion system C-terminal sorting domain-containing protein n=1 Tax=Flavobacterium collinsii TaxID=1114861 RepID=A0ABM8KNP8_9FLAO|nr:T9SS type A sorting domain-containing protein [Flavobacterium collinsii]CAA9202071.1 hypothetical protein FLACOL7796_04085 [Flavobacterium collinsii]